LQAHSLTVGSEAVAARPQTAVEPVRAAGHRFLGPAPAPAVPGFSALRKLRLHGFQLTLLGASKPTPIAAAEVPGTTLFPGLAAVRATSHQASNVAAPRHSSRS
jgi:hypothetical protein